VDRIGNTPNLEEHWFDDPYTVELGRECASPGLAQAS
jgi:ureidoglycolate lyase